MHRTTCALLTVIATASAAGSAEASPPFTLRLAPDLPATPPAYVSVEDAESGQVLLAADLPGLDDPQAAARMKPADLTKQRAGKGKAPRARVIIGYTTVSATDERSEEETTADTKKPRKGA